MKKAACGPPFFFLTLALRYQMAVRRFSIRSRYLRLSQSFSQVRRQRQLGLIVRWVIDS
jgi:hypothetical protein